MDCHQHDGDNNVESTQENDDCSVSASVTVKMEEPPHKDVLESSLVKEEQVKHQEHFDHSDINDALPMRLVSPKGSRTSVTRQEMKVRPLFIKEEAIGEEKPCIKTETNVDPIKKPLFKCNTCNLRFRNSVLTIKKLINCVKNNPCLYDLDHKNFDNITFKSVIWSVIAAECNFSNSTIASTQWETLKTKFIKTLMQHNTPNSTNWKYYDEMQFLMPYITDQDLLTNLNVKVEVVEGEANYSNVPRLKRSSSIRHKNFAKRKRTVKTPRAPQSRPLYMFFRSMCATTKNLPEYVQLQVKKKVFQAVTEAEENAICNNPRTNLMNEEFHDDASQFLN